jgi:hypothetical protein
MKEVSIVVEEDDRLLGRYFVYSGFVPTVGDIIDLRDKGCWEVIGRTFVVGSGEPFAPAKTHLGLEIVKVQLPYAGNRNLVDAITHYDGENRPSSMT